MSELYLIVNILFVQNLALSYGLGLLPTLTGTGKGTGWSAFAGAVIPILIAGCLGWAADQLFRVLLDVSFIRTIVFALMLILIIQLLRFLADRRYEILGGEDLSDDKLALSLHPYTHASGAPSVLIGVMALASQGSYTFADALIVSTSAALGYGIALALHNGLLSRMELDWVPRSFRGLPLTLIGLGFLSLVFMAVSAVVLPGLNRTY